MKMWVFPFLFFETVVAIFRLNVNWEIFICKFKCSISKTVLKKWFGISDQNQYYKVGIILLQIYINNTVTVFLLAEDAGLRVTYESLLPEIRAPTNSVLWNSPTMCYAIVLQCWRLNQGLPCATHVLSIELQSWPQFSSWELSWSLLRKSSPQIRQH